MAYQERKNHIRLYRHELESMPEYSSTIPTGHVLYKMWKRKERRENEVRWVIGQYVPYRDPGFIGIRWYTLDLKEGPEPPGYRPPDWSNYQRYQRVGFGK